MKQQNTSNQIIIYESGNNTRIEVNLDGDTVWLSQAKLAALFNTTRPNITMHIKNIFDENELNENSVCKDFLHTASDGKNYNIKHYNLDLIISLGYRIKSQIATNFRIWATNRLKEYIIKGFTMDDERLKNNSGGMYWKELLNRIKDIRSSEKVLYRQVLDLYATSIDYDPKSEITQKFFAIVQNKLHYAANGKTAAEIIAERANAEKPFMGLLTFGKNGVRKSDIAIAKNYLTEIEIKKLNNVVSAYFDIAELRALDEKPTSMQDYINNLDKLIVSMDRNVLKESGKISHVEAEFKAISEYSKYQQKILSSVEKDYLDNINQLEKKVQKTLKSYNPKTK